MNVPPVVSNSSALIALDQIGRLTLLPPLFTEVLIPPAVVQEIAPTLTLSNWLVERTLAQPVSQQILHASLGSGESEAIALALEAKATSDPLPSLTSSAEST
jgi:predicted nucleic acid-binding protein